MNEVITFIADSMVKAVGVAGIEAMAMRRSILAAWTEKARALADEVIAACIDFESGTVRSENADGVLARHRLVLGQDFIEKVIDDVVEYAGTAYDRGVEHAYQSVFTGVIKGENYYITEVIEPDGTKRERGLYASSYQEAEDKAWRRHPLEFVVGEFVARKDEIPKDIIEGLSVVTGATRENVQRTIKRWFQTTQGEYFERFIVPETARLMSYAEEKEGNIASLRSIGEDYKKFVEADGYWSSVSEYNAETSKVFAQVQTFHELHISHYKIEAIIDNKTCAVCMWLNGSEWSVENAYERVVEMLVMEADQAYDVNPFPPRSTPKDYESPADSPYGMPPYHPRCRCNVVSSQTVTAAPRKTPPTLASQGYTPGKPPTDRELTGLFNRYVQGAADSDLKNYQRVLTGAEFKRVKEAFKDIPYELRKWVRDNNQTYKIATTSGSSVSRVIGNVIEINEKYLAKGMGPEVIQHELRHALINKGVIRERGGAKGAEALWEALVKDKKTKFPMPIHVNEMYKFNRGSLKASTAVDEFMAMVGDYYKQGMSMDELVSALRAEGTGIEVERKIGSLVTNYAKAKRWTAAEAKRAAQLWWEWMDIDNYTLMSKKQLLATMTYKPVDTAIRAVADGNEIRLEGIFRAAGISKANRLGDNEPFDVWIGADPIKWYAGTSKVKPKHVIEVKTIVRATNDKITMHKPSKARKVAEWSKFGKRNTQAHTIVFDERTGKVYYKPGVGSYRLSAMQEVSEADLQKLFGGKPATVLAPSYRETYTSYSKARTAAKEYFKSYDYQDLVDEYAGANAYKWNRILRGSKDLQKAFDNLDEGIAIEAFFDALEEAPTYKGVAYRGIRFDSKKEFNAFKKKVEQALKKDKELLFKGFTSTSPDIREAYKFMGSPDIDNVILEIKGARGVVLEGVSKAASEKEVIFNAFTQFDVVGFKKINHPIIEGKYIWKLTLEESSGVRRAAPSTERLAEIHRASPKIKTVKSSTIKTTDTIDNGNVNEVRIVTVGKGKKKYIFKPVTGESYYSKGDVSDVLKELDNQFGGDFKSMSPAQYAARLRERDFPDFIMEYIEDNDCDLDRILIRRTITNDSITLAQREAFALDVANRLGLDNEYGIVPKFMLAEDKDGNIAGVLIEYIPDAKVETAFLGRKLYEEEKLQMAVFDYIIGNTDRHENNWMRKEYLKPTKLKPGMRRTGTPIYIDHGYIMPNQTFDLGGITEIRMMEAAGLYNGVEYDLDPDFIDNLITKISKFAVDADDLATKYGFDMEEVDAMLRRTEAVMERLRAGSFGDLMHKHEEDNLLWGLMDSYIE